MNTVLVVGYIRVSTKRQKEQGYGLEEQQAQIEEYCDKNGHELIGIFADEALSGANADGDDFTVDRDKYYEMLDAIAESGAQAVVVLTTNRLWRSDMAKVIVVRDLKKLGCDVLAIDRPGYSIYTKEPNDFLVNGIMELLDVYETMDIKLKMTRGRMRKAQSGGYSGGAVPFGYKLKYDEAAKCKKLEIEQTQAKIVRRIFELLEGFYPWGYVGIAEQLESEGLHDDKGRFISASLVRRIVLKKEFYAGVYRYAGVEAKGEHDPII
ncbi:recombinase family protein [Ruminococcaceae bacterium OttesenSCG-928-O06]|nr:recombinase family protein [Ruminococcaceae bacterium OttesenSCG-928-O06]